MLFAVDSGKHSVKLLKEGMDEVFIMRNKLHEGTQELLSPGSYNITYNNKHYVVGRAGLMNDPAEGKDSEHHLITTLVSLALNGATEPVQLIYGESAARYKKNKEAISNMFKGIHFIIINGTTYTINIDSVLVLPEGLGHVLSNLKDYQKLEYIVDIGGLTMQFLIVDHGSPIKMLSFKLGMNSIVQKISNNLNKLGYDSYPIAQIEQDLLEGTNNKTVMGVIDNVLEEQLVEIHNILLQNSINLHDFPSITFVGGTSIRLADKIKATYLNSKLIKKSVESNVRGFLEYGKAIIK